MGRIVAGGASAVKQQEGLSDVGAVHSCRADRRNRWLLEIVGFWTPDYLARKLALYRATGLSNLILCIDDERQCAEGDLPVCARVLRFRRRVDARAVLRFIDGRPPPPRRSR